MAPHDPPQTSLSPSALGEATGGRTAELQAYLLRQRWYQRRSQAPRSVRLFALSTVAPGLCWALLEVRYPDTADDCLYQLPVCTCAAEEVPEGAVILRLAGAADKAGPLVLADAVHHASSRLRLLQSVVQGQALPTADGVWRAQAFIASPDGGRLSGKVLSGEQSNTSIVFSSGVVLKLFRRLQAGVNPDLEMTQYLSVDEALPCVPKLHASMQFERADGARFDVGMLQQFIGDAADGWRHTLEGLSAWLQGDAAGDGPCLHDAATLGTTTRAIHEALAHADRSQADFHPEAVSGRDVVGWIAETIVQCDRACADLRGARDALGPAEQATCDHLLQAHGAAGVHLVERLLARLSPAFTPGKPLQGHFGLRIRHHGDYHLGQVLRRQNGAFVVLDFEGEPLRSLADRRCRHSPLRDVAGMLRSFAYAAHSGARTLGPHEAPKRAQARAWEQRMCARFVEAYERPQAPRLPGTQAAAHLLPAGADERAALLQLFVVEKAFYELRYELSHRPDWVGVPLGALAELLRRLD